MSTNRKAQRLSRLEAKQFLDDVVRPGVSDTAVETFFNALGFDVASAEELRLVKLVDEMIAAAGSLHNDALEPVEGAFSSPVFRLIEASFSDEDIGDEQFWTYISVRFFWRFVARRQRTSWHKAEGSVPKDDSIETSVLSLERYLIGADHYQIPLRMYLRAQSVISNEDTIDAEGLAAVPGTDFWRSQILAVRTSHFPLLARCVVRLQKELTLSIEEQRPAGRLINRLRNNIEFAALSEEECAEIAGSIWGRDADGTPKTSPKRPTRRSSTKK
jgi:hypothetical protein